MKAQYIRDDIEASLAHMPRGHEEQWEYRDVFRNGEMQKVPFWKKGAVIDHPDSWQLVQMGCCIPADEDCLKRAHRTPEQLAAAQKAYSRLAKGIHPEDFQLFDDGVIVGYKPDGSYDPGPNFHKLEEAAAEKSAEDDDEGDDK